MSSTSSRTPSLTPSRSPTPEPPVQPDHFYGSEDITLPPSPDSDGKTWLDPADDPMAHRGIPVFKPSMEEFRDFEAYMNSIECWGSRSGIVKVIPPKEWKGSLPPLKEQLSGVKIKSPIEQHMIGHGGLFRQENVEKRRIMSVREWAELCSKEEFRAPGIKDVSLHSRSRNAPAPAPRTTRRGKKKVDRGSTEVADPEAEGESTPKEVKKEEDIKAAVVSPPNSTGDPETPTPVDIEQAGSTEPVGADSPAADESAEGDDKVKGKTKRATQTRASREAQLAERATQDAKFLEKFDPHKEWLPAETESTDYTPEFCQKLERQFWRNCGLGKPAWYGADTQGSLYTDETTSWNVAHLPSTLSRLLPSSDKGLPGVNTPYLYFGMWRATFAWHVEDMDLFSINYIHFGAPKFWYAIPQGRAGAMEQTMRGYFPKDTSNCPQFLRHKSFLASPTTLAQSSCRPNILVQQAGEFVITYPRGYHAGFNLGFNCAESVNFALDSWLELGRKAKACECVSDSVRIDVDQLLRDREAERSGSGQLPPPNISQEVDGEEKPKRKRKSEGSANGPRAKKAKPNDAASSLIPHKRTVKLTLGPKPAASEPFPCCLCVSMSKEKLLRVHDPPVGRRDIGIDELPGSSKGPKEWMAHEECANIVPETWVDFIEVGEPQQDEPRIKEQVVFGVDGIVKDRWNLKCSACTKTRHRVHGAPVQCTKGKCSKAFHVSCARDGIEQGIVYKLLQEVEKEVILTDPSAASTKPRSSQSTLPSATAEALPEPMPMIPMAYSSMGEPSLLSHANELPQNTLASSTTVPAPMVVDAPSGNSPCPTPAVPPSRNTTHDAAPQATSDDIRDTSAGAEVRVLKTIKKWEMQILCSQHNPDRIAAKRANRVDKTRQDLLALPPMARIKIRVSAGLFEVSLVRVMEENQTVEVIWDRGFKREFKWGSVLLGNAEGQVVLQKPAQAAPDLPYQSLRQGIAPSSAQMPSTSYYSTNAPYAPQPYAPPESHYASHGSYQPTVPYGGPSYGSGSWSYQQAGQTHAPIAPRGYPPYHSLPVQNVTPGSTHQQGYYPPQQAQHPPPPIPPPPPPQHPTYRGRSLANLQWQPSYTGPTRKLASPTEIRYYTVTPQQQSTPAPTATNSQ